MSKKKETPKEPKKTRMQKLESTQMWSPIKDIKDGIVITKDGRYVKILEFAPINFRLLPEDEQMVIADAFGAALRTFPTKVQIKVMSRQATAATHIADLQGCLENESNEACRRMQRSTINHIRKSAAMGITRRFFIIFAYEKKNGLRRPSWQDIRSELYSDAYNLATSIMGEPCNNDLLSPIEDTETVLDILYNCMCRAEAEMKPLREKITDVIASRMVEENFSLETASIIPINDFLAPRRIDPYFNYIVVDGKYYTFGYINQSSYPTACYPGWTADLINLGEGIDVDIWTEKKSTKEVAASVSRSMQLSLSEARHRDSAATDIESLETKIQSEKYIRAGLASNQQFLYFAVMITVIADDLTELRRKFRWVQDQLIRRSLQLTPTYFAHDKALLSSLPLCNPDKSILRRAKRNILTDGFGAAYPFNSYEINDPHGVMIGTNCINNSAVFVDLFDRRLYNNGNVVVLGSTGAGKTYLLQCLALRLRQLLTQVIIITPDKGHEYRRACESIGGSFISLAPSSPNNINVMEIRKFEISDEEAPEELREAQGSILTAKVQQLHAFFSLLKPDMTQKERQMLDEAMLRTYAKFGITVNNNSLWDPKRPGQYKRMPILGDLFDELAVVKETEDIRDVLARFVNGSARSFNAQTNVDLDNQYVVLDASTMPKELMPLAIFVATDYVNDNIRKNRFKRKAVFLDEIQKMIGIAGSPLAAEFILTLYKTVRSYNAICVAATQDTNDFFALKDGIYGNGILANAKVKILMKPEVTEVPVLAKKLQLSETESSRLIHFSRGDALLLANRNHAEIRVIASQAEHRLITTDPEQLRKLYGNARQ